MTTPAGMLRTIFDHHLWATGALIDHLERLPGDRLDATVPGTYGSMIATLTHLMDADDRYLLRIDDPNPPRHDRDPVPLAVLRGELADHGRRWDEVLKRLESGELHAKIRNHADYPDTDGAEGLLLLQAVHHGNDHRTQICSTLGAVGEDVPDLDGWEFWRTRRSERSAGFRSARTGSSA